MEWTFAEKLWLTLWAVWPLLGLLVLLFLVYLML